jgi:hypothetical protein
MPPASGAIRDEIHFGGNFLCRLATVTTKYENICKYILFRISGSSGLGVKVGS